MRDELRTTTEVQAERGGAMGRGLGKFVAIIKKTQVSVELIDS